MPHSRGVTPLPFVLPTHHSSPENLLQNGHGVSVYLDLQPANDWPRHSHERAQIVFCLDSVHATMQWGEGDKSQCVEFVGPHVWVVPHGIPHAATWRDSGAMVVLYVDSAFILAECGTEVERGAVLPLEPCAMADLVVSECCREFRSVCRRERSATHVLNVARATVLAAHMLRYFVRRTSTARSIPMLHDPRVARVISFVEQKLKARDELTRTGMARVVRLTEGHLSRRFKAVTGFPLMRYVLLRRLHRARDLLRSGEWKVVDVAAECGFSDQSHLVRVFKAEFGCTPKAVMPKPSPASPRRK